MGSQGGQQAPDTVEFGSSNSIIRKLWPFLHYSALFFLSFGIMLDFPQEVIKLQLLTLSLYLTIPAKREYLLLSCSRKYLRDDWKALIGLVWITFPSLNQWLWSEDRLIWSFTSQTRSRFTSQILRQRLNTTTTENRSEVVLLRDGIISRLYFKML